MLKNRYLWPKTQMMLLTALFLGVVMALVFWASAASPCGNVANAQTASCPVGSTSVFEDNIGLQGTTTFTATIDVVPTANRTITLQDNTYTVAGLNITQAWTADQTFNDSVKASFGTGGDADIYYDGTNLVIEPQVVGSGDININDEASLFFNETSNANQVTGLTINALSNALGEEIVALKSSDFAAHSFTSLTEGDTYGFMSQQSTDGGLIVQGFNNNTGGLHLKGHSETNVSGCCGTTEPPITLGGALISGSTAGSVPNTGNVLAIQNNTTGIAIFTGRGDLELTGGLYLDPNASGDDGFIEGPELSSDPSAPSSNFGRLYFKDNGSGKTQLVVRFPTGAVQVIATEP